MAIIKVHLTDTVNGFRLKVNAIGEGLGDTALLDTSGPDSSAVSAINSLDSDMGRQADLNYKESSDGTFLTVVDAINRIVDSSGNITVNHIDSDFITHDMLKSNIIDSDNLMDSVIMGSNFDAMTVFKVFNSTGTVLRKIYAPSRFDKDSADTYKSNPWV